MEATHLARISFRLLAFGLFVYQFQYSIYKLVNVPIIQLASSSTFEEINKPLIYLCQDGQFNYATAREKGYSSLTGFTTGHLDKTDNYSWNGKYGNSTYQELKDLFYQADYTDVNSHISNTNDLFHTIQPAKQELFAFYPKGNCLHITPTQTIAWVTSSKRSTLFILDPVRVPKFGITGSNFGRISLGPTGNGYFEGMTYKLQIIIDDKSIHDGVTCNNYEKNSYEDCVTNVLEKGMMKCYGCLPPWFSHDTNLTCKEGKMLVISDIEKQHEIKNEFYKLNTGLKMKLMKPCLPPCIKMRFSLEEVDHYYNRLDNSQVQLRIKNDVTIYTDKYAYDMFNLVIDLGSSLGLWLGLSALSIVETFIEFYIIIKTKYFH